MCDLVVQEAEARRQNPAALKLAPMALQADPELQHLAKAKK